MSGVGRFSEGVWRANQPPFRAKFYEIKEHLLDHNRKIGKVFKFEFHDEHLGHRSESLAGLHWKHMHRRQQLVFQSSGHHEKVMEVPSVQSAHLEPGKLGVGVIVESNSMRASIIASRGQTKAGWKPRPNGIAF